MKIKPFIFSLLTLILTSCISNYEPDRDYRGLLTRYAEYDNTKIMDFPALLWQDKNDPALMALRDKFNFDEICTADDDWEKAKQLALWIKDLLRHDGAARMPKYRDALSLLTAFEKDPTISGYNCRLLALIFQDCALSLGIKARVVFLGAKDLSFDSHVVIEVYSPVLKHWNFLDPTYCAWFVEGSSPLSAFEMRQRLAQGLDLPQVNPESGYNGGPFDVDYQHYLSKNLFYIGIFAEHRSGYDEGKKTEIHLCPNGFAGPLSFRTKILIVHNPSGFYD